MVALNFFHPKEGKLMIDDELAAFQKGDTGTGKRNWITAVKNLVSPLLYFI